MPAPVYQTFETTRHEYQPVPNTDDDQMAVETNANAAAAEQPSTGATAEYYNKDATTRSGELDDNGSDDVASAGREPQTASAEGAEASQGLHILESRDVRWYSYMTTADFWIVLGIGQILALCITSTNTFSSLLAGKKTSIPAFQSIFNYCLLCVIYNTVFLVKEGPKAWGQVVWKHGWKYLIMSFLDVEGNYFTVLAYRYTNIMSAQLINFWAIVCVVVISFFFLKVRYSIFQVGGILICMGGMGILIASDYLSGGLGSAEDMVKGDMFALVGATCYGLSNVFEEWLVSKAPMYHVLSFIGLFGIIISGVQAAIFDRAAFREATWDGQIAGYLVGFTLCLCIFYSLVPILLRMASAGFYNISLLTANFWGVLIGIRVFHLSVHFMYPIAFVCIIIGLVIYFLTGSTLGESKKPWLGDNQEEGFAGFGTAKLKAMNAARNAQLEPENGQASSSQQ